MKDIIAKINESNKKIDTYNDFVETFDSMVNMSSDAYEMIVNGTIFQIQGNGEMDIENPDDKFSYRVVSDSTNKVIAKITVEKT